MNLTRFPDLLGSLDPLDDAFRSMMRPWRIDGSSPAPQMRLEVREQDGTYDVMAEIPGVRKEDIDIRIEGNQVSLSAEVKKESEQKEGERSLRSERYYGYVNRSFTLANDVDAGKASAQYENGVLHLTLPKKASSEARRLSVS